MTDAGSSRATTSAVVWKCTDDGDPIGMHRTGMLTPPRGLALTLRALRDDCRVFTPHIALVTSAEYFRDTFADSSAGY